MGHDLFLHLSVRNVCREGASLQSCKSVRFVLYVWMQMVECACLCVRVVNATELRQWQEMLWLLIMAGKTWFLTASHFQPLSCWFCHLYWYSQSGILKVSICASVCLTGKVGEGRGVGFIKTMFSCKENNLLILHLNVFFIITIMWLTFLNLSWP